MVEPAVVLNSTWADDSDLKGAIGADLSAVGWKHAADSFETTTSSTERNLNEAIDMTENESALHVENSYEKNFLNEALDVSEAPGHIETQNQSQVLKPMNWPQ